MFKIAAGIEGVTIAHNSALGGSNDVLFLPAQISGDPPGLPRFVFQNNVIGGYYALFTDDGHGAGRDALAYLQILAENVTGNVFLDTSYANLLLSGNASGAASQAGLADYAGRDLMLTAASPYRTAGVGGTTPGGDMAAIKAATDGVVR